MFFFKYSITLELKQISQKLVKPEVKQYGIRGERGFLWDQGELTL